MSHIKAEDVASVVERIKQHDGGLWVGILPAEDCPIDPPGQSLLVVTTNVGGNMDGVFTVADSRHHHSLQRVAPVTAGRLAALWLKLRRPDEVACCLAWGVGTSLPASIAETLARDERRRYRKPERTARRSSRVA